MSRIEEIDPTSLPLKSLNVARVTLTQYRLPSFLVCCNSYILLIFDLYSFSMDNFIASSKRIGLKSSLGTLPNISFLVNPVISTIALFA